VTRVNRIARQIRTNTMWKITLWSTFGLAIVAAGALVYGSMHWQSATDAMHAKLEVARSRAGPKAHSASELIGLTVPVQRYFRAALTAVRAGVGGESAWHARDGAGRVAALVCRNRLVSHGAAQPGGALVGGRRQLGHGKHAGWRNVRDAVVPL
jgi:hypothetical protein